MWTEITRAKYDRSGLRYASDLTDAEWALIEPELPSGKRLGRRRTTNLREVVNALLYLATTGCQWRMLPSDFPPRSTVQDYFYPWARSGVLERINHALVVAAREQAEREASPSAGVIDSQSVKTTESGGPRGGACPRAAPRADPGDAGKKINGRKRHIVTDTEGHLLAIHVHPTDIQDRDGAVELLAALRSLYPWLRHLFADGGYAGTKSRTELAGHGTWTIEVVKRPTGVQGFDVLPRRWVVERAPQPEPVEGRLARALPPSRQGGRGDRHQRRRLGVHRPHPPAHPAPRKSLIYNASFPARL